MINQQTIICAFCGGSGRHPYYFKPPCPVCKGKGENVIVGEVQECKYCKGSGRKSTTTLTCYYCGGLGVAYSHRPNLAVRSQYPDKDVIDGIPVGTRLGIEKVVEETLKKCRLAGLGDIRQEIAVIGRTPVSGVLREEKEMKVYVNPISGVRKESAGFINQAVASLKDINKKEQVAGLTKVDQGYFENTVALLTKMKKERGEKTWKIQK